MKLWIDGDNFPAPALKIALNLVCRRGVPADVVADRRIDGVEGEHIRLIQVDHGSGLADSLISEGAGPSDVVLTRDLGLAHRLVVKGVTVMNDRGRIWSKKALMRRMEDAGIMRAMRAGGMVSWRGYEYNAEDACLFKAKLTSLLEDDEGLGI